MVRNFLRSALAFAMFVILCSSMQGQAVYSYAFTNFVANGVNSPTPWTGTPDYLATGLSASQWATSYTKFIDYDGPCGSGCESLSISGNNYPSSTTYTLTFTVNAGYALNVTGLSFWNRESAQGPTTANITINGTAAVNSLALAGTTWAGTGTLTPVNTFTNLTGSFTMVITLSGATSTGGTFRIDSVFIDGTVTSATQVNTYAVTGGGSFCTGGTGVVVGLANSDTGVTYQLVNGGTNTGSPVAGTGSAISFGPQTAAGTYTVVATSNSNHNTANMTGSATVVVNAAPVVSLGTPAAQCGGTITLDAGNAGSTFAWSNGSTTETIAASTTGTYTVTVTNSNTCSASASALVTINTPPTLTVTPLGGTSICANASATITAGGANNYAWSNGGTVSAITVQPSSTTTYTVTGSDGGTCTATATYTVTVSSSVTSSITTQICQGLSYDGHTASGTYVDTFTAVGGCDSIRTLSLTVSPSSNTVTSKSICAGQSYQGHTTTGNYSDTLSSVGGCDSIITLQLTVSSVITTTFGTTICQGQTFQGHSTAGTYSDTLTSVGGCDSIAILNLLVTTGVTSNITASICVGENYYGHTTPGTFVDTLQASGGCDSIRTLNLTVLPAVNGSSTTQTICNGQSYGGHTVSGNYSDTLTSVNGCDSVVSVALTVLPQPSTAFSRSICQRDTFMGHWTTGLYTDTLTAANGCDSVVYLNLTVNPLPHVTLYLTFDTVCNNAAAITMSGGSPAGGYYTGQGIVDTQFVPSVAPIGWDTIYYNYVDSNGCFKDRYEFAYTLDCDSTLGIASNNAPVFALMPNPTHDYLTIENTTLTGNCTIEMHDMLGRLVVTQPLNTFETTKLDMGNLPAGVYIVTIAQAGNKVYNARVVKE